MAVHWTNRWIGWRYVSGRRECTDFVSEVQACEFGRRVIFPRGRSVRERDRMVAALTIEFAEVIERDPRDGDGVLMRVRGRRAAGHHIGLWCAPGGEPSVLHAQAGLGGVLHPLDDLSGRGLEVVGLYGWLQEPGPRPVRAEGYTAVAR